MIAPVAFSKGIAGDREMKHLELIVSIRAKIDEPTEATWTCFDLLEERLQQELSATQRELETLRRARARLFDYVAAKDRGAWCDPTLVRSQLASLETSLKNRSNAPTER